MRRINFKKGVRLRGLQPEMLTAIDILAEVFERNNLPLTLTSAREGNHGSHSHHYKGLAVDIRVWDIADSVDAYASYMREALGPDYEVVVESDHIHVEFDPQNM